MTEILKQIVAARQEVAKVEVLLQEPEAVRRRFEVLELCGIVRQCLTVAHRLLAEGERPR